MVLTQFRFSSICPCVTNLHPICAVLDRRPDRAFVTKRTHVLDLRRSLNTLGVFSLLWLYKIARNWKLASVNYLHRLMADQGFDFDMCFVKSLQIASCPRTGSFLLFSVLLDYTKGWMFFNHFAQTGLKLVPAAL